MQDQNRKSAVHLAALSFLTVLFVVFNTFSQNVITWVPPYNMQACENMLATDFGGVKMTDGVTHVALQFWGPVSSNGSIKYVTHEWQTPDDQDVIRIRNNMQAAGVKTLLCVYNNDGVWNWNIVEPILTDPAKRSNFVKSLTLKMDQLGLDGVEIDLEYPHGTTTNNNKTEFYAFMQELCDSVVTARGKEVTIATFAYEWSEPKQSWWNDLIAMGVSGCTSMGYEQIGMSGSGWASYSSQKAAINDPTKLMLGMPTYSGGSWLGNTTYQQVAWAVDNGVGIGIWDASLANGSGTAEPSWRTAQVWNKIAEIKGSGSTVPKFTINATASSGGGISPLGNVSVDSSANQFFSISANGGYEIDYVTVDGNNQGAISSYTFNNVTVNHTISAFFKALPVVPTYQIAANAVGNGSVSPAGATTLDSASSQSYSIVAATDNQIDSVVVDGVNVGVVTNYSFNSVKSNHTITAYFSRGACDAPEWISGNRYNRNEVVSHNGHEWMSTRKNNTSEPGTFNWDDLGICSNGPSHKITSTAGSNGSISPDGELNVTEGENQTYSISANSGYEIDYVTVDGINQGAIPTYTFNNVTSTHTINAYFKLIPVVAYNISASSGSNGTISPNGNTSVNEGNNQTFIISAYGGYEIDNVIVDGVSQGAVSSYTFNNVTSNHTISASFKIIEVSTVNKPFPMALTYPGVIKPNNVTQSSMNLSIQSIYNDYKSNYLRESSVSGDYYIESGGTGGSGTKITVSEAHGYGMMIFALMAGFEDSAKVYFDGMYDFYKRFPSTIDNNFMSWEILQGETIASNANSASDGDMDIAYALLLAHDQWGSGGSVNYLSEANRIIAALKSSVISPSTYRIKLGDWAVDAWDPSNKYNSRSSDWMTGHINAYKKATGDNFWTNVNNEVYTIVNEITNGYSSSTGLMSDFVTSDPARPDATGGGTGEVNADKYYWNGCRYPWRITMDYLHYNTSSSRTAMMKFVDWAKSSTGEDPGKFYPGYNLNGTPLSTSYHDIAYVAPLVVASIVDGSHQSYLNSGWSTVAGWAYADDVYGKAIQLMSMLTISGNWWAPGEPLPNTGNYTITASASTGGSISPSGAVSVAQGNNQSFSIAASNGYEIDSVYVDGVYAGKISSYTFTSVTANHSINAIFKSTTLPQHTVTVTSGANGSISPSGTVSITEGGSQTFTITANNGYEVDSVFVDGSYVGSVTTYTLSNVTGNHSVNATFKALPVTYTISSSAGANGSITPSGSISVSEGGSQLFTISANTGYVVDSVIIDGANTGAITSYTFSNVTANHSINAYFKSSGTGGSCDGVPAWYADGWTTGNYVLGYKVTNANHLWEVINEGQTHWEPSGSAGHFGWADLGECGIGGPDTTIQTSQVSNVVTYDTTVIKDSVVNAQKDTVVETEETIISTDETINKTDSLSDGAVFATVFDTVVVFDTTINLSYDTLIYQADTTVDTTNWNVVVKDTVSDVATEVNVDKDTITTTTTSENLIDSAFTSVDSLSDGVVFASDTSVAVSNSSNILSVVSDTSFYQADTTTNTNNWNVVVRDTVVEIVSEVPKKSQDTIVTTTTTENITDSAFTSIDSLSDGVIFASDTSMVVSYSSNVLSVVIDTNYYHADTTTNTNNWNVVVKDTVVDVTTEVNVDKDTITTTTTTENVIDSAFTSVDSLSDGVIFASDTSVIVSDSSNILSVVSDTSFYQADTTTNTNNWNVVVKDTVVDVTTEVNVDKDTITTTTTTENVIDSAFTSVDSLSDGVVYVSDTSMNVSVTTNLLSVSVDTSYYKSGGICNGYPEWVPGTVDPVDGDRFVYGNHLWEAQNDPSIWESPSATATWFWIDLGECGEYLSDTTTNTTQWNVVVKDTVADVSSEVNVDQDTIVTTTTTENVVDSLFTSIDSLSDGVIYSSDTTVSISVSSSVLSVKIDTLKFDNTVQFTLILKAGWSYISFNVISSNMSVESIFADVGLLETVKDDDGNIYMPGKLNTIGSIDVKSGYKVYTLVEDTIAYFGTPVDVNVTSMQLNKGWNIISYLPANLMAVEAALESVVNDVDAVKDDDGGTFMPGKLNTLINMKPGKGYKINMKNSATLVYPEN